MHSSLHTVRNIASQSPLILHSSTRTLISNVGLSYFLIPFWGSHTTVHSLSGGNEGSQERLPSIEGGYRDRELQPFVSFMSPNVNEIC
jgi:hypothetical protein